MPNIVIYQKPTCTTCRTVYNILKDAGVDFESVNYYVDPIPKKKMKELLKKLGMPAQDLLRKKEPIYKELGLDKKILSEEEVLELMEEYPGLLQRPIVEKGSRAILARPAEKIKEIL
jgi:arsenate reductase